MPPSRKWCQPRPSQKFYGDSQDGEFPHCLLCKYNPNKGVDVAIKVNILCFCLLTFCKCHLFDYSIINDQVGGASGLRNHLKNFHKKEFLDMQHGKEEKTKKKNCQFAGFLILGSVLLLSK